MKIVFVSSSYNHHQAELCKEFARLTGNKFVFVETIPLDLERQKQGWVIGSRPDYVLAAYKDKKAYIESKKVFECADIGIWGSAPYSYVSERLKNGLLTFRYSERIFKNCIKKIQYPIRLLKNIREINRYSNLWLLAASAYATRDYNLCGSFINKSVKWGYFPECKKYNFEELWGKKDKHYIIWVGRLIKLKHPESMIQLAITLKRNNLPAKIIMIGNGEMEEFLKREIHSKELYNFIEMKGGIDSNHVRDYMEKSTILATTSDHNEGWGAIINEGMNSGCIVIASRAMGAVPFLIKNGINGYIFKPGYYNEMSSIVMDIIADPEKYKIVGKRAYDTIITKWNASIAAKNLITLSEGIKNNFIKYPEDGPCSKA